MKVLFTECDDDQANWGRGKDPREYLTIGNTYTVVNKEVHSWHTLYYLEGFSVGFNSVCFEEAPLMSESKEWKDRANEQKEILRRKYNSHDLTYIYSRWLVTQEKKDYKLFDEFFYDLMQEFKK